MIYICPEQMATIYSKSDPLFSGQVIGLAMSLMILKVVSALVYNIPMMCQRSYYIYKIVSEPKIRPGDLI